MKFGVFSNMDSVVEKWYAVYTRFKHEKVVASRLRRGGIHAYVPLTRVVRRYRRKVKVHDIPLLSQYVFVHICLKREQVRVLSTSGVLDFVRMGREIPAIPQEEIDILRRVAGEDWPVEVLLSGDELVGREVEIIGGALTGIRGTVVERKGKTRVLVALRHVGVQLLIEVPLAYMRLLQRA